MSITHISSVNVITDVRVLQRCSASLTWDKTLNHVLNITIQFITFSALIVFKYCQETLNTENKPQG